ncbi:MAG: T9SS type A sorting domain-containing protein [Flavobacteriales bacterium]|nr:T9SS type A sorting domain-containing protein [Flavobacteriales bacterium]
MRTIITLSLIATTVSLSAQLQNGGFEDLSPADLPAFWSSGIELIAPGDSIVVDSAKYLLNTTDVHSGLNAVELRNAYDYTTDEGLPSVWFASSFEEGYGGFLSPDVQITERPQVVEFWAKYAPVQGDSGYAEVKVINEFQEEIGSGSLRFGGNVDTYTAFAVPINYSSTDSAAVINIRFSTIVPGGHAHLGTRMLLDDVEVNYMETGITEVGTSALTISPNPAVDQVRITGLGTAPHATALVFSTTGHLVRMATMVNGTIALDGLPSGAYLLQVDQAGQRYRAPLVIAR